MLFLRTFVKGRKRTLAIFIHLSNVNRVPDQGTTRIPHAHSRNVQDFLQRALNKASTLLLSDSKDVIAYEYTHLVSPASVQQFREPALARIIFDIIAPNRALSLSKHRNLVDPSDISAVAQTEVPE